MAYRYSRDRWQLGAYHVFNRARDGLWLFRDNEDRRYFEQLIDRHVGTAARRTHEGREIAWLRDQVSLTARNLLFTHYHLMLLQKSRGGIDQLMRRVIATYTRYYNEKYGERGPLFDGPFRARRIESPAQFRWRTSYVHDNHKELGLDWPFSTHTAYLDPAGASGALDLVPALKVFGGSEGYENYMRSHGQRQALDRMLRQGHP